jgi:predicted MFS family arabinose efflux permease
VLFLMAAVVTFALLAVLMRTMPPSPPEIALSYRAHFRAAIGLAATEPILRQRAAIGACIFGTRSAFWATIAFVLAGPPYHFSAATIGLFLLVAAFGAVAARLAGGAADRGWERPLTGILLALGIAGFGMLWAGGTSLPWLIAGLLAGEVSAGGVHLLNMSVVYGLVPQARARIAAVYMTSYTTGGIVGAALATLAYRLAGWPAVCIGCGLCLIAALIPAFRHRTWKKSGDQRRSHLCASYRPVTVRRLSTTEKCSRCGGSRSKSGADPQP